MRFALPLRNGKVGFAIDNHESSVSFQTHSSNFTFLKFNSVARLDWMNRNALQGWLCSSRAHFEEWIEAGGSPLQWQSHILRQKLRWQHGSQNSAWRKSSPKSAFLNTQKPFACLTVEYDQIMAIYQFIQALKSHM